MNCAGRPPQSWPAGMALPGVSIAPAASMASLPMRHPSITIAPQSDERAIFQNAAVHHRQMADQHIIADQRRKTLGLAGARAVAMDDAAILHVGARADDDAVDVGTDHAIVPDARIRADLDIADDAASRRDEGAVMNARGLAVQA